MARRLDKSQGCNSQSAISDKCARVAEVMWSTCTARTEPRGALEVVL